MIKRNKQSKQKSKDSKNPIEPFVSLNSPGLPKLTRFPIRLSSQSVTSVSISTQILIFWLLFQPKVQVSKLSKLATLKSLCTNFFISQMKHWPHNTGKGLSEFLTDAMLKDLLKENPDLKKLRNRIKRTFAESN